MSFPIGFTVEEQEDDSEDDEKVQLMSQLEALKSNVGMLNDQLFKERKQWLQEKQTLLSQGGSKIAEVTNKSTVRDQLPRVNGDLDDDLDDEDDEEDNELAAAKREAEELRQKVKMLTTDFYRERRSWLEEKRSLSGAGIAPQVSNGGLSSASVPLNVSENGVRPFSRSVSAVGGSTDDMELRQQVEALKKSLKEMGDVMEGRARQWAAERSGLMTRLQQLSATDDGEEEDTAEAITRLTEERDAARAEIALLKDSFKNCVVVPRDQYVVLSKAKEDQDFVSKQVGSIKTTLEELQHYKEEVERLSTELEGYTLKNVVISQADYAELQSCVREATDLQTEVSELKSQLARERSEREALEAELATSRNGNVEVPVQEYEKLRAARDECSALQMRLESMNKYCAMVPKEDMRKLQAARQEADTLMEQLTATRAMLSGEAGDMLAPLQDELRELRTKCAEMEVETQELRTQLSTSEARSLSITALEAHVAEMEAVSGVWEREKRLMAKAAQAREEEFATLKTKIREALSQKDRLAVELSVTREAAERDAGASASLASRLATSEARLNAARQEMAGLSQELVSAKLELARLREMEVLMKREVYKMKLQLHGAPSSEDGGHKASSSGSES